MPPSKKSRDYLEEKLNRKLEDLKNPPLKCVNCGEEGHINKFSEECSRYKQSTQKRKNHPNKKDSLQTKIEKAEGRKARRVEQSKSSSSSAVVCTSCGISGHGSARSKECVNYKKSKEEVLKDKLGKDYETYTRKIKSDTVVRPEYHPKFKGSVLRLNEFLREVIIKAQL